MSYIVFVSGILQVMLLSWRLPKRETCLVFKNWQHRKISTVGTHREGTLPRFISLVSLPNIFVKFSIRINIPDDLHFYMCSLIVGGVSVPVCGSCSPIALLVSVFFLFWPCSAVLI